MASSARGDMRRGAQPHALVLDVMTEVCFQSLALRETWSDYRTVLGTKLSTAELDARGTSACLPEESSTLIGHSEKSKNERGGGRGFFPSRREDRIRVEI